LSKQFVLDGVNIAFEDGQSILDAALKANIYIPHLCHHPDLPDIGACGMCVVEIDGKTLRSCVVKAEEGISVISHSDHLDRIRTTAMQLMLSSHIDDCNTCPKYLKCELQSLIQQQGVSTGNFRRTSRMILQDESNPLFIRDMERCIVCGRCVRACKALRGVGALTYANDEKNRKQIVTIADNMRNSDCRFCGACVEVCPTGALRDKDGVFVERFAKGDKLVPCSYECPAHLDIPAYLRFISCGENDQATAKIMERAPFPRSLGSICMRFCEDKCRRQYLDSAVSVCELKRFAALNAGDGWKSQIPFSAPSGKKVAIVGAGPTGLTAAWLLKIKGHDVEVFEAEREAGGMMRYGMPEYRLSSDELKQDIEDICSIGIEIHFETCINDYSALSGFDAVLWCGGAQEGIKLPLNGADCSGVLIGLDFLKDLRHGKRPDIGQNVLVLGGGDVAYDCARSALRLGAKASVCCIEPEDKMTSSEHERVDGTEEGVVAYTGRSFERIVSESGKVSGLECCFVTNFEFDDCGHLKIEKDPSSLHTIPCDTLIFAVGQRVNIPEGMEISTDSKGHAAVDDGCRCGNGFFAAGDAVIGTSSVVQAVGWGQKAAAAIDCFLGGNGDIIPTIARAQKRNSDIHENCFFNALRRTGAVTDSSERKTSFMPYIDTLDEDIAVEQAMRCLQCDLRQDITRSKFYNEYTGAKKGAVE
jgi:formate dehydrogenase beta subunit